LALRHKGTSKIQSTEKVGTDYSNTFVQRLQTLNKMMGNTESKLLPNKVVCTNCFYVSH